VSVKQELHRVLFHGALHLCGYRDKSPREIRVMRRLEDKYLGLYLGST
jgi:ssRNA-specific RNase YbeY (16S rRNA maturation enzyme)